MLDNGAYTADAPFFPQLAAMMAVGPYRIPHVSVDAHLAYTNTTPSGSVRAPTAPQACWALEQHIDAVAEQIGIDPVELRRRNIVREGDESATRQVFTPIGAAETLERAVEMIGYGKELPDDEAIGVACGWWPSFAMPSGAHVKLNGDGSGTIMTGAQECGTGAVMALPMLAAEVLGMQPEQFTIVYQDTDAGPWDAGASGSQTTFNNGRAVVDAAADVREQLLELAEEALEAARADLELVDGAVQVKGSPDDRRRHRRAGRDRGRRQAAARARLGHRRRRCPSATPRAASAGWGWSRSSRRRSSPTRCAARSTARPASCACSRSRPRTTRAASSTRSGADGQVEGGVVMGIGMALLGGHAALRRRPPAQPRPARLQAADGVGRPADQRRLGRGARPRTAGRTAPRASASRRACRRRGRSETRSRRSPAASHQLPMTPERVWETMQR